MSLEYKNFAGLPATQQEEIAALVSSYTKGLLGEIPQMLPVEPEDLWNKQLGYVALADQAFAGYIGASPPEVNNGSLMAEVGTLWVPLEHRKKGIAHQLINVISQDLHLGGQLPYAFGNKLSQPIFEILGYQAAPDTAVPPSALGACALCPAKPDQGGCCDTILVFEGGTQ